jgi:hypothetical protein
MTRRRGSGSRRRSPRPTRSRTAASTSSGSRIRPRARAAVAVGARVERARGTTPSCRRARSAARRRRSRPRGARRRRRRTGPAAPRQLAMCGRCSVGHLLAVAEAQASTRAASALRAARVVAARPARRARRSRRPRRRRKRRARRGAAVRERRNRAKYFSARAAADREEVDDWSKSRVSRRCAPRTVGELAQARHEAVVADAQQRPRSGCRGCRSPRPRARPACRRRTAVPVEHVVGDEPVVGRAPRHHRRHPRSPRELERTDPHRREEPRPRRLRRRRPLSGQELVLDPLRRLPHAPTLGEPGEIGVS